MTEDAERVGLLGQEEALREQRWLVTRNSDIGEYHLIAEGYKEGLDVIAKRKKSTSKRP